MVVRKAVRSEVPTIVRLLRDAFTEFEPHFDAQAIALTNQAIDSLDERWDEGPVWVAVEGDSIVGTVTTVPKGGSVYIRSMAVTPAVRGLGVGRALLEQAECFAFDCGVKRLFLSTTPHFAKAVSLYERSGYRVCGEERELYGQPMITMEKFLAPTPGRP